MKPVNPYIFINEKLKKLIQFAHSPENEDMSDGEVLDYLLDELEKITS